MRLEAFVTRGVLLTGSIGDWATELGSVPSSCLDPGEGAGPRRDGETPGGWGAAPERPPRGELERSGRDPRLTRLKGAPAAALSRGSASPGPPAPAPPLTHPRTARATTPRGSPLARYLSRGHPPTWPLHFRDTTLRTELRGGTEGNVGADGGGRTSVLQVLGLSRGGARSLVEPRPLRRARPRLRA